jgi:CRISPR/Cas system-associated exonuclease Cas4 (RecB family)
MDDLRFKEYFLFTQHSLVTFNNCPLKFKKKYLDGLKWETFPDENVRINIKRGLDFHLLANRYFLGIDVGLFENTEEYQDMINMLSELRKHFKIDEKSLYLPEFKLRITNEILKLEANYDLILIDEKSIYIYDWKTRNSDNKINLSKVRSKFSKSLQTIVYMYVLSEQIELIKKMYFEKYGIKLESISKYDITMIYWMPEKPYELARIDYSKELHGDYKEIILNNIKKIMEYDFDEFNKEEYIKHCKFCEFNWFCNNKKIEFNQIEENDEFLEEFDWDNIETLF